MDPIVSPTAVSHAVSVADFTTTDCPALVYCIKTSPPSPPGGASIAFTTAPSFEVTQNNNIDSFAVSITHEGVSGTVYAYTAFIVHAHDPSDPTAADFVQFCTDNASACICPSNINCPGSILDFCVSDLRLDATPQTNLVYDIFNPPVPTIY